MKYLERVLVLLALMLVGVLLVGGGIKYSSKSLADHLGSSTVALVISVPDEDPSSRDSEVRAYCTGVWVDSHHILTANHCVDMVLEHMQKVQDAKEELWKSSPPCLGVELMFGMCQPHDLVDHYEIDVHEININYVVYHEVSKIGEEPSSVHLSHVLNVDSGHDLALLEVVGSIIPEHTYVKIAERDPLVLTPLVLVGHPKGYYWTFLNGSVSSYRMERGIDGTEESPYMQVQGPGATNGNSGGGAFNMSGELVGLADFGINSLPSELFYIDADNLRYFVYNTLAKK